MSDRWLPDGSGGFVKDTGNGSGCFVFFAFLIFGTVINLVYYGIVQLLGPIGISVVTSMWGILMFLLFALMIGSWIFIFLGLIGLVVWFIRSQLRK